MAGQRRSLGGNDDGRKRRQADPLPRRRAAETGGLIKDSSFGRPPAQGLRREQVFDASHARESRLRNFLCAIRPGRALVGNRKDG